jgi:hypothetical protein
MELMDEQAAVTAHFVTRLRNKAEFIDVMNNVGQEFHDSRTDENELHFEISDRYSTRLFDPAVFSQSSSACTWRFTTLVKYDDHGYPATRDVTVVVIFADSQVCTLQPTGNMIPEMKVICSDGTVYDAPTEDTAKLVDDVE